MSGHLSPLEAIVLGIVQGATEFLPVSSTAHMRVVPALLHWGDPGAAFSAVVQLGPIVAIIAYFRSKLAAYGAGIGRSLKAGQLFPASDPEARLGWFTVFGTVPLIVAALLLESKVDKEYRNLYIVGGALILLGVILLVAERVGRRNLHLKDLTFGQAMGVGLAQMLALVPGASRSGCTITAGLFCGLTREDAADFSFLLSIPAITLAGVYKLYKVYKGEGFGGELGMYVLAAAVAGVVAYLVIRMFLSYLKDESHTTGPFIAYRVLLGIVLIALAAMHVLTPDSLAGADTHAMKADHFLTFSQGLRT
jgi:undecaprenyl-diphosphatase